MLNTMLCMLVDSDPSFVIVKKFFFKVYIQFMKFARRSESIKESRAIFKKAREDTRTNFHVGFLQKKEFKCIFNND